MTADLQTLLREHAPRPQRPVDVEDLFTRVERRRRGRQAAGVAAVLTAVTLGVGALQLLVDPPLTPVIEQPETDDPGESAASALTADGVFDRGVDEVLRLDPDADERLHGRVLADLDTLPETVAVATDRAIGLRDGTSLSILAEGEVVATAELGPAPDEPTWWGRDATAFDTDGTLWALHGRTLVGLRRDGTLVEHDDAVTPVPGPLGGVGLRVTGTDVSVVVHDVASGGEDRGYHDFEVPLVAEVVPVVGQDPLAGVLPLSLPARLPGEPEVGVQYAIGPGIGVSPVVLSSASIVGGGVTELDWEGAPIDTPGYQASTVRSQVVAGTAASLVWTSFYDGSFLVVDRDDGTRAVAVVAGGPHPHLSVSPDGAVHVTVLDGDRIDVRTLLTPDLRPLQGRPIEGVADLAEPEEVACSGLRAEDEVLDVIDVDLDVDGRDDRVLLFRRPSDRAPPHLFVCLADGTQFDRRAHGGADRLLPADLAGTPGVAAISTSPSGTLDTHELVVLVDAEVRDVHRIHATPSDARSPSESGRTRHLLEDRRTGRDSSRAETFGCRSAGDGAGVEFVELRIDGVEDEVTDDGLAVEHAGDDLAVSYVVRQVEPEWRGITEPSTRVELPVDAAGTVRAEEVLAELGATWLCRP